MPLPSYRHKSGCFAMRACVRVCVSAHLLADCPLLPFLQSEPCISGSPRASHSRICAASSGNCDVAAARVKGFRDHYWHWQRWEGKRRGEIIPPEGLRGRNLGASSLLTRLSVFTTQSLASLRFRKLGCTQPGGRVLAHRGGEPESSSPGTQQTDISADFSQEKAMQGSDH